MPSHLMAYFVPRPPLEKIAPPPKKVYKPYVGLADLLGNFENIEPPPVEPFEAPKERRERLKQEKATAHQAELKVKIGQYDPHKDDEKVKTMNPHKTLFVGRLSHETTQKKLLKVFEEYGPVTDIRLVTDKEGKPRGYAFIEYKTVEGLRTAFREANNKVLDGRKIVVDVEKARTHENWLPRRLGGGEGPPRSGISKKVLQMRALERRHAGGSLGGGLGGGHMGGPRGGGGRGMGDGGDRHGNRTRGSSWGGGDRMRRDNHGGNYGRGGGRGGNWDFSARGGGSGGGRGYEGRPPHHGNSAHSGGGHEGGGGGRNYGGYGNRDGAPTSAPYRHNNSNSYHDNDDRHGDNNNHTSNNRREDRHMQHSNRSDPYGSGSRRNYAYNNSNNAPGA